MCRRRSLFVLLGLMLGVAAAQAPQRILLMSLTPASGRLYIARADGSDERALTPAGAVDYNPSWSARGDWIAFTSERGASADLYRIHPDGTGLERLTDDPAFDDQAAFAPDGRNIVFVSTRAGGRAHLWLLDMATRATHVLTSGAGGEFRPAWSPDGQWIAFSSDRDSDLPAVTNGWELLHLLDIYVIHPDGTGLKRISAHGGSCGGPSFAPDSASVVVYCMTAQESFTFRALPPAGGTRLVRIKLSTGETSEVAAAPGIKISPHLLPSGQTAWVSFEKPGVFYADGHSGPAGDDLSNPSWSPDGVQLVYGRGGGELAVAPHRLFSHDSHYELYGTAFFPAYDATGRRFAVTLRTPGKTMSLYIVEEGQAPREVYRSEESLLAPQWSPDGHQLLLTVGNLNRFHAVPATQSGKAQLALINTDGSGLTLITSGGNDNAFGCFSPDGRRIVYRTSGADGQGLRMMQLDTRAVTVLTRDWDNFPAWSPRDGLIAFTRKAGDDFAIFTIHPDGSGERRLTFTRGIDAHPSFSADGRSIAFTSSRAGFRDEALNTTNPQPYGEIFVMSTDGSNAVQLTDNQWEDGAPVWQPHSR